jgi:hypothetical protein
MLILTLGAVPLFATPAASPSPAGPAPCNIILIGWDGCQRGHLQEMIARNEVPNLMTVAGEGRLVDIDITAGATDTKAGWTQILTGYAPVKTGVFSNSRYQPIPAGYSVFERLEDFLGADGIDTVALIAKKGHVDNDSPRKIPYEKWLALEMKQQRVNKAKPGRGNLQGGTLHEENGRKYVLVLGKPWLNASRSMDLFQNGLQTNERVVQRTLEELEQRKDHRFFFFVHFAEPDHAGHKHGENSMEYTGGISSDDEKTGRILAKLKALGLYEKTLVYITADHGFDEGGLGHRYAPYVFLATNDTQVNRDGNRMDIAPTLLQRFGLDLAKIRPALDGVPLDTPAPDRKAPAMPPLDMTKKQGRKALRP